MTNFNPAIKKLVEELEKIQTLEDKRLAILLLFLYSEHYAIKLLKKNNIPNKGNYICPECNFVGDERGMSLNEKIQKFIDNKIINENLIEPFTLLNKIRNKLIHDISPKNEVIIKWINEYSPTASTNELKLMLKNTNHWIMLQISLVTAITNLYEALYDLKDSLICEVNPATGLWVFHVKE